MVKCLISLLPGQNVIAKIMIFFKVSLNTPPVCHWSDKQIVLPPLAVVAMSGWLGRSDKLSNVFNYFRNQLMISLLPE